jgi:hypoxanthine phosphoribosyltransferase
VTELGPVVNDRVNPSFAHASEAEMARILDFYDVRWEYEPTTFPILWNLEGEVVESFSPDFYLPELDMFLEMTTLKQRLVRKKNRKLRRLRELYPDIRIKLFYARDFAAMMLKYGRFALVESLSGTIGQMVPDRSGVPAPILGVRTAILGVPAPILREPAAIRGVLPVPLASPPIPAISTRPEPAMAAPAGGTDSSTDGELVRRSRTAARRLRRRHLRAAASPAGVGSALTHEGDHHASEASSE